MAEPKRPCRHALPIHWLEYRLVDGEHSLKPTCPTCGRMPSERFGEDFAKCEYPGDGETHGPMVEYVPTGYVTARCPDPIHDLADRLVAEHATPRASEADAMRDILRMAAYKVSEVATGLSITPVVSKSYFYTRPRAARVLDSLAADLYEALRKHDPDCSALAARAQEADRG